jgi:hypothetical protein
LVQLNILLPLTYGPQAVSWQSCFSDRFCSCIWYESFMFTLYAWSYNIHPCSLFFLGKVELISWLRLSRWNLVWHLKLFSPAICILCNDMSIHSAVQVLGTPTREEIKCMNPNYMEFKFPQIKAHPWHKVICVICLSNKIDAWLLGLHNCFCLVHNWHTKWEVTVHHV